MIRIIIAAALALTVIAGCSTYDTSGAGATSPYGDNSDYRYESSTHNSAL